MKQIEAQHQRALVQWARLAAGRYSELRLLFSVPNGGRRDARTAAFMKAEGALAGIPDLCLPVPRFVTSGEPDFPVKLLYAGLWIEMKSPRGRLTPDQFFVQAQLRAQGHRVEICRHWMDARSIICEYLGIADLGKLG